MEAQWLGIFSGRNNGHITLNLEQVNNQLIGHAILVDFNTSIPSFVARLVIQADGDRSYTGDLSSFLPINKATLLPDSWEKIKNSFDPSVRIPTSGTITFTLENAMVANGEWTTDVNTNGKFQIKKSSAGLSSEYPVTSLTWDEFKQFISELDNIENYLFRGQAGSQRLRTTYHRTGRSDIARYTAQIPDLQRYIYSQTNYLFNLENPFEYAALLSLVQHHGYPTPLLDWSKSPYVASYFAYKELVSNMDSHRIRIYVFDAMSWKNNTITVQHLDSPILSLTPLEVIPILNNRAIPQQSVTTFSNVDDIEAFIQSNEQIKNNNFLKIIELPVLERSKVLRDLNLMNVHSGSLFPGLDGICQMLKNMHFN